MDTPTNDTLTFTLKSGLRMVHRQTASPVAYVGLMMNTGSRDDFSNLPGLAHCVEHTLFKGTQRRTSRQIINRMEDVGGEMNAYTTKEETVLYTTVVSRYAERAVELMADMLAHSVFPEEEVSRELDVILDEIELYKDTPTDQIYDDFEALLFSGHALANPILGQEESVRHITPADLRRFVRTRYHSDRMVFFSQGNYPASKALRWAEKYLEAMPFAQRDFERHAPTAYRPDRQSVSRQHNQVHYICGSRSYPLAHPDRPAMFLLNNIVGGPGMNSLLNLSLRERAGLVYTVEGNYSGLSDTGVWTIYFGCDSADLPQCVDRLRRVLRRVCDKPVSDAALRRYKQQLAGQLHIAAENQEGNILSAAKSLLHLGRVVTWQEDLRAIDRLTPADLLRVAREMYAEEQVSRLVYLS